MQHLLDLGCDINAQSKSSEVGQVGRYTTTWRVGPFYQQGDVPVKFAMFAYRSNKLRWLLARGADPSIRNCYGITAWDTAVEYGCRDSMEILMEHAEPDELNKSNPRYLAKFQKKTVKETRARLAEFYRTKLGMLGE